MLVNISYILFVVALCSICIFKKKKFVPKYDNFKLWYRYGVHVTLLTALYNSSITDRAFHTGSSTTSSMLQTGLAKIKGCEWR